MGRNGPRLYCSALLDRLMRMKKYFKNIKTNLSDKEKHLNIARKISTFLDTKFTIWKFKFGLDPILGLVPGIGDIITATLSFYIVFVAVLLRISVLRIIQMIFYILIDFVIGGIPILGDMLDFAIKPNIKNMAILEKEVASV